MSSLKVVQRFPLIISVKDYWILTEKYSVFVRTKGRFPLQPFPHSRVNFRNSVSVEMIGVLIDLKSISIDVMKCLKFTSCKLIISVKDYWIRTEKCSYSSVLRLVLPFMAIRVIRTNTEHFSVRIQQSFTQCIGNQGIFPKIRITFKTILWELWASYSGLKDQNNLLKVLIKLF